MLQNEGIRTLMLPYQSPNLNAHAERWVRSVKEECLERLIIVGEPMLRNTLKEYQAHFHHERNHQGCIFRRKADSDSEGNRTRIPNESGQPFRSKADNFVRSFVVLGMS